MKRILIAGAFALVAGGQALAADIPPAPPPPPPPRAPATYVPTIAPVYNWSGIYIGANGGYDFATSNWTDTVATTAGGAGSTGNFNPTGFLAGGTIGANAQWGSVVFGIEGDWDWSNLSGSSSATVCTFNIGANCQTSSDWLGTARGRIGYAFDRLLLYGTGGAAFAPVAVGSSFGTETHTEIGWTAGAGLEFAFAPNWTAKVEYLYVNLGNTSCSTNCFGNTVTLFADPTNVKLTENVIRAGLNFKFGPWW